MQNCEILFHRDNVLYVPDGTAVAQCITRSSAAGRQADRQAVAATRAKRSEPQAYNPYNNGRGTFEFHTDPGTTYSHNRVYRRTHRHMRQHGRGARGEGGAWTVLYLARLDRRQARCRKAAHAHALAAPITSFWGLGYLVQRNTSSWGPCTVQQPSQCLRAFW